MLNPISAQFFCKNTKNIQKSDYMDGFCLQGELDLTLFYKIEGHLRDTLRDILKTEILNDLNDRVCVHAAHHDAVVNHTLFCV